MPDLIEDTGEPLSAGHLCRLVRLTARESGALTVGDREVHWELIGADTVQVAHTSADGNTLHRYSIGLVHTPMPSGAQRWWWACPTCRRRVGLLYLPASRDRFACRRCCELKYGSQYGKKRRPRKRRPVVVVTRERREWTLATGWVPLRRRTLPL